MEAKDYLLQVKDVSVSYRDNKVIEGVSLNVERGKIYSIIGPNGCGKTTLIRVMGRNMKLSLSSRKGPVLANKNPPVYD